MTQHLHQQDAVILGQLVALVEIVLGAIDLAGEVGQRIALGIDVRPERPQSAAAHAFAALGGLARFILRDVVRDIPRDILGVQIVQRHIRIPLV